MLSAAELRLRLHDMVCMSACGRPAPAEFPDEWTEADRRAYLDHHTAMRVDHARTMSRHATAFRRPDADHLQVVHDAVCRAGADCPEGPAHLSDRVRVLVAEWQVTR